MSCGAVSFYTPHAIKTVPPYTANQPLDEWKSRCRAIRVSDRLRSMVNLVGAPGCARVFVLPPNRHRGLVAIACNSFAM